MNTGWTITKSTSVSRTTPCGIEIKGGSQFFNFD